ncbi:MAG: hypothetical protein WDA16_12715 [Candidatus Thermoplasmatota archaeon]
MPPEDAKNSDSSPAFDPLRAISAFGRDHWPPLLAVLTASAFTGGLAYFHGFLGRLGFDGLVQGLSVTTILAYGALAATIAFTGQLVLTALVLPCVYVFARRAASGTAPTWITTVERKLRVAAPIAAVFVIAFVIAIPWQWLVPQLARILSLWYPWSLWIVAAFTIIAYVVALLGLRGRYFAIFIVAVLIVSVPGITLSVGEQNADWLQRDPDAFSRVLLWENETQSTPAGYVLVHQEDDRLYLLLIQEYIDPDTNETRKLYRATTRSMDSLYRIEFIPAGVEEGRFRLESGSRP